MKFKFTAIIFMIIILLLSLGFASASDDDALSAVDVNDLSVDDALYVVGADDLSDGLDSSTIEDLRTDDDYNTSSLAVEVNDSVLSKDLGHHELNAQNPLGTASGQSRKPSGRSFNDLQNCVNGALDNDIIILDGNYKMNDPYDEPWETTPSR